MKWNRLNQIQWEGKKQKYDFVIEKDDKTFILSIFNSKIKNSQSAYIEGFEYSNLNEAKKEAELYI